jgi:hypothetical protein
LADTSLTVKICSQYRLAAVFTASGEGVNFIGLIRMKWLSLERGRLDMVHLDLARPVFGPTSK